MLKDLGRRAIALPPKPTESQPESQPSNSSYGRLINPRQSHRYPHSLARATVEGDRPPGSSPYSNPAKRYTAYLYGLSGWYVSAGNDCPGAGLLPQPAHFP